ncbi:MAG TPA: fumarylacetoacetate hydrolase family protein [Bryobacteraceae bacterium]|jgi:2-keto-4-pentenoate hydratase/2-oxohepta-3-ene-1,7-dioic acid hydratase in catechol pathway|nr:fumarylacetoacetate hydrolase family protein [Bryobacteraceae bacterium]
MRLVSYDVSGQVHAGLLIDDAVVDLAPAGFSSVLGAIENTDLWQSKVERLTTDGHRVSLSSVKLLAPIPAPRKLICVGLNYLDHAKETGAEVPKVPTIFNKFATSVIGPGDQVKLPKVSNQIDYEAELAFVIGRGGRHIAAQDWRQHVFGYTIVNDVSARDYQRATSQWLMGKTFDTFAPMGPCIVTADEIADPHNLKIGLRLNGKTMQNSNTKELIFKVPELIAFLSSVFTLEPGDIVSTGTPAGVGFSRKPPVYLQPDDEMVVSVEHVGELKNSVVAEQQ